MKPYSLPNPKKGAKYKIDTHIHINNRKIRNWWETECKLIDRGAIKQITKKEINKEIELDYLLIDCFDNCDFD